MIAQGTLVRRSKTVNVGESTSRGKPPGRAGEPSRTAASDARVGREGAAAVSGRGGSESRLARSLTQEAAEADQLAAYQRVFDAERRRALRASVHPPRVVLLAAATDEDFKRERVARMALYKRVFGTFGPEITRRS